MRRFASAGRSRRRQAAAELELRRPPASVSGPAARIGAAALRDPRIDVDRDARRAGTSARGPRRGRSRLPGRARQLRLPPLRGAARRHAGGAGTRRARWCAAAIRITLRRPRENDILARGARRPDGSRDRTHCIRRAYEHRDRAPRVARPRRLGPSPSATRASGSSTTCSRSGRFMPASIWSSSRAVTSMWTSTTPCEDVLAALGDALAEALGDRQGVTRYGSATIPMDEASATAAVDLVRRPHAEISLAFTGERVGGLALSLLPHALERFAMQAGCRFTSQPPARTTITWPRRGSRRSAGRCGRRVRRQRRRPVDEGARVKARARLDYGAGNLRSVCSALARAGARAGRDAGSGAKSPPPRWRSSPASGTPRALPRGLGPLADVLRDRVACRPARVRICVGLQILFEQSDEGARASGCSPAGFAGSTRRRCRTWAGTTCSPARRLARSRRSRRRRRLLRPQLRGPAGRRGAS